MQRKTLFLRLSDDASLRILNEVNEPCDVGVVGVLGFSEFLDECSKTFFLGQKERFVGGFDGTSFAVVKSTTL